jgi:ArsR family transcriptional regulator
MRELVKVLKAVADKNRLRIFKMLQHKKMCVCELAAALGISMPSVSRHLSLMKDAGLIEDERDGMWTNYMLSGEKVNKYAPVIQARLKEWINDDEGIKMMLKKAETLKREELCAKVGSIPRGEKNNTREKRV